MPKMKSKLNEQSSEIIKDNFLEQDPEGLPITEKVVAVKEMPEMKKVIFLNGRDPGYPLDFHYHSKTHPLKHYTLYHGKEHLLSQEIIDHLESCAESQYAYRPGPSGHPQMYTKSYKYLFSCKPSKPGMRQVA